MPVLYPPELRPHQERVEGAPRKRLPSTLLRNKIVTEFR